MWPILLVALFTGSVNNATQTTPPESGGPKIVGGFCCDERDVATCKVFPFQPVGDPCWCPGMKPDGGHVCL